MSIEENKQIVARFWENFSKCEFKAAQDMMAEKDFTWWLAGNPEKFPLAGLMTKEKFNGLLGKILEIAPKGIQVTPKTMTAEGDRVAVEAESYAETITGKIYRNQYHFLITVRNGKVQSVKEYLDTMHTNEVFCQ